MIKQLNNLNHTAKILHETFLLLPNQSFIPVESNYQTYISYLNKRYEKEGINKIIKLNKEIRLSVTRFICGKPWNVPFLKAHKDSLPCCLGPLADFIRTGDSSKQRYVLSILSITKSMTLPIRPDFKTISDPMDGKLPDDFMDFATQYIKTKRWKLNILNNEKDLSHLTTKAGPNGQALATGPMDLFAMPEPLVEDLLQLAPEYMAKILPIYGLGPDKVKGIISDFGIKPKAKIYGRKLVPIEDKEGKTRIIATGEYFTQAVLKPIHDSLLDILKSIPQDMTFTQNGHPKQFGDSKQQYHSLDLSSATDRFPIALQKDVMEILSGSKEHANLWAKIMTGYPFSYKDTTISYKVGQPMGFYSSWPVFTLTHHIFVMYCASKVNIKDFSEYLILGDDIVIKDDIVANYYRSTLINMGVGISESKTLVSYDTFEFAKRLYHKGEDISPVPSWSLINSVSSTELAGSLTEIHNRYGFTPHPEKILRLTALICSNSSIKIRNLGKAHRLVPLMYQFPYSQKEIGPAKINYEKLNYFLDLLLPNLPAWPVNIKEELLLLLMSRVCEDYLIPELRKMISTYDNIMKVIRSMDIRLPDQDPLPITSIPLFEVTSKLNKELSNTYDLVMAAWIWEDCNPLPFRSLMLVDPVKLTQDRNKLKLIGVTATLVMKLKKEASKLNMSFTSLTPEFIHEEWIRVLGELDNVV